MTTWERLQSCSKDGLFPTFFLTGKQDFFPSWARMKAITRKLKKSHNQSTTSTKRFDEVNKTCYLPESDISHFHYVTCVIPNHPTPDAVYTFLLRAAKMACVREKKMAVSECSPALFFEGQCLRNDVNSKVQNANHCLCLFRAIKWHTQNLPCVFLQ